MGSDLPSGIRVLFVDDSSDIRELYEQIINLEHGLRCVGTLESTVGLEIAIRSTGANVAVIDLVGPGRDAIEAIRAAAGEFPDCRIIAFSGHDDDQTRDLAIDAGAWTLVSKNAPPLALIEEIRQIAAA